MNNMANREEGDKLFTEVEQALGAVFNLMASHPAYAGRNIADLHAKLLPPIAMRQYRIVRGKDGNASAFMSWALVGDIGIRSFAKRRITNKTQRLEKRRKRRYHGLGGA